MYFSLVLHRLLSYVAYLATPFVIIKTSHIVT